MTCKEYIIEKFGEAEAEDIIYRYCPSTFNFEDTTGECVNGYGCDKCWDTEQKAPEDFDAQCKKFIKNRKKIEDSKLITHLENIEDTTQVESPEPRIQDSGDRTEFESGAVRDRRIGKGRCDLMPLDVVAEYLELYYSVNVSSPIKCISKFQENGDIAYLHEALHCFMLHRDGWALDASNMLLEVAKHFEEGCAKYGENNWRKGIPVYCYIDSAIRHYLKYLRGDTDERHDRAFCWNIMCCIWTVEHLNNEGENKDANNG